MAAVILINSAIFGVYTFLSEFLKTITNLSGETISLMLFVYGGASLIGNIVAGRSLVKNANRFVVSFPISLAIVYFILFLMGQFTIPMALIIFFWGILAVMANNISQYWITSAAPEAPDFANGMFLTSGQLGVTIGITVSGIVITSLGIHYVVFVGILASLLSLVFILIRNNYTYNSKKQQLSKI